ncbi:hypothetical protein [Sorangium sp. So ce693]|uniref:hypothetical protein n=1 Tax=Sorangium sp. So ce693 TaxID=3133318 RepID=UPI003F645E1D
MLVNLPARKPVHVASERTDGLAPRGCTTSPACHGHDPPRRPGQATAAVDGAPAVARSALYDVARAVDGAAHEGLDGGGQGGDGGYGGPGRGGDSIGIAYLDEDQLTLEGVTFEIGLPGPGGTSWEWTGDVITGEDGIAVKTQRFPE